MKKRGLRRFVCKKQITINYKNATALNYSFDKNKKNKYLTIRKSIK